MVSYPWLIAVIMLVLVLGIVLGIVKESFMLPKNATTIYLSKHEAKGIRRRRLHDKGVRV